MSQVSSNGCERSSTIALSGLTIGFTHDFDGFETILKQLFSFSGKAAQELFRLGLLKSWQLLPYLDSASRIRLISRALIGSVQTANFYVDSTLSQS